ncbi:hypothetical protein BCR36DRAFT_408810 [Piromyces finnis]|uniref:DUF580-domain-containing protein n=1 Tax=Piromyces finnis TaxID=1754191 RepID=A0A1Y1VME4_9FUNG|nr:hypothetical protein BCR36DRAFT_408810 [Piromyces finnis]|eukprot:ORX59315.1 hypothetical protein BCR36DRAFT_408810 [Piromyces finnis]
MIHKKEDEDNNIINKMKKNSVDDESFSLSTFKKINSTKSILKSKNIDDNSSQLSQLSSQNNYINKENLSITTKDEDKNKDSIDIPIYKDKNKSKLLRNGNNCDENKSTEFTNNKILEKKDEIKNTEINKNESVLFKKIERKDSDSKSYKSFSGKILTKVKKSITRIKSRVYSEVIIDEEKMAYLNNTNEFPPNILRLKRFFSDGNYFLLLLFSTILTLIISSYSLLYGNIYRILYSTDSDGNICGYGAKIDKTALNLVITPNSMNFVCFEQCNSKIIIYNNKKYIEGIPIDYQDLSHYSSCIESGKCFLRLPSKERFNRCFPTVNEDNIESLKPYFNGKIILNQKELKKIFDISSFLEQVCFYTLNYRFTYLKCATLCIIITYMFLLALVYTPKIAIYSIFSGVLLSLCGLDISLWYIYITAEESINGIHLNSNITWINKSLRYPSVLLMLCVCVTMILVLIVFIIVCLRVKINISLKILYETSKCFRYILYFFCFPIIQFIIISTAAIIFFDIMILLYSNIDGIPNRYNRDVGSGNPYIITVIEIFTIFFFFWIMNLLIGICKVTVSVCAAIWYWDTNKTIIQRTKILSKVLKKVVSKAIGTLSKGSLYLSIFKTISKLVTITLFSINKQQDSFLTFWLYILKVILFFLIRFIYSITNNSYVEVSIYGGSFWKGAQKAFLLLMENSQRLIIVDTTATVLVMLIKLIVVALGLIIGFFFIDGNKFEDVLTTITPFMIGYYMLFGLAQQLIDPFYSINNSIFFCFCDDTVYNDGSEKKPYYMSYSLQLATRYINTKLTSIPYDNEKKNQHIFIEIDKRKINQ